MRWKPTASLDNIRIRAECLKAIRAFFEHRQVLEVDTPLLALTAGTDVHLSPIPAGNGYLQTSPEFAMKRLLAAGFGSIYQICKAFRQNDVGQKHQPEFTMLEWYRPGWSYIELMTEVDALLQMLLNCPTATKQTYAQIFEKHTALNPHTASIQALSALAYDRALITQDPTHQRWSKEDWLDFLFGFLIEPQLGLSAPVFVYDYPATEAALASVSQKQGVLVAERFEVYYQGLELGNAYNELCDPMTLRQRFLSDNDIRKTQNLPLIPIDEDLLAAMTHGLPASAGIAMGIDRLIMLKTKSKTIQEVVALGVI